MTSDDTADRGQHANGEAQTMRFPRRVDALSSLFEFSAAYCDENGVSGQAHGNADFVLEEIFTNFVKYNADGAGEIEVGLRRQPDLLEIWLIDFDSDRFDPRETGEVAIDAPLEERTPGGLGIHLVKKIARRIDYDYIDRRSRVTIFLDLG